MVSGISVVDRVTHCPEVSVDSEGVVLYNGDVGTELSEVMLLSIDVS